MIDRVFEQYAKDLSLQPQQTAHFITDIIAAIRPPKPHQTELAVAALQTLCDLIKQNPKKEKLLREAILKLLSEHNPISLFLVSRHSAFAGFFTEIYRRFAHKILPEAIDPNYLIDLFALFFNKPSDAEWVMAVPDIIWEQLIIALHFEKGAAEAVEPSRQHLLNATQVLSYRIAALGLEPELLRNHPELEQHSSPFITQHAELTSYIASKNDNGDGSSVNNSAVNNSNINDSADIKHILVMLDQCNAVIAKIRRNSTQTGTSIRLTYLLQSMSQQISRLETLLHILDSSNKLTNINLEIVHLFKALVYSECHKNDINAHWQENVELMALRVTENASRTGEHYITENRSEYFALMRSAMGAGIIVAIMATLKIMLAKQHLPQLTEAILFSLNYGLGFVLIHILHFTVATKQPAMTAAAIAASIDANDPKSKEMDRLVTMIAKLVRSQIIAIIGNVIVAIPTAMLITWAMFQLSGQQLVTPEHANNMLTAIDPLQSGAIFYAGIAGICLFLSGLIAGYHDNLAVYNKIPQRLRALAWLQKLLGVTRLNRVANYVEKNLGALAGNFYFGCLLGGMTAIGVLVGLPVDIRHISFSSAFFGFAIPSLDFMLSWQMLAYTTLGLAIIGFMNLTVSFSLALYVAMKSRKVRLKQWRILMKNFASRLNQHPGEFLFPPKQ